MRCSAASRLLTFALAMRDNMRGLATLLTPSFLLFGAWVCVTVVLSLDPGTSIRRFALTACVIAVDRGDDAAAEIAERTDALAQHRGTGPAGDLLSRNTAGAAICRSIWRPIRRSPRLAGDWRGVVRPQERGGGRDGDAAVPRHLCHPLPAPGCPAAAIVGLASLFLFYAAGKSSLTLCFAVLLLTSLTSVVRSFWAARLMLLLTRCCCSTCSASAPS